MAGIREPEKIDVADGRAKISDGERTAWYRHHSGDQLDMAKARVKPAYIDVGAFCEAMSSR